MADFLLELGCEEIPARMLPKAENYLYAIIHNFLDRNKLLPSGEAWIPDQNISILSTPRRLTAICKGMLSRQEDAVEVVQGPAMKVAYKDGVPTAAAGAFAKKVGIDVTNLRHISTPKGEYVAADLHRSGKSADFIIAEEFQWEIEKIQWPKSMYWRKGTSERFVRPVRWMVALLDEHVIPLEFGGIQASNQSRGHRVLGPERLSIVSPTQYIEALRNAHVMASSTEREQRIRKALDAVTRTVPGARWREDDELLKTIVNLTEWPSAILGNFDQQFLSLPEEVLVTVMRDHQKYFAVEDVAGKLAPHFLTVLNTDGDPDGLIRHGNERVLRARFNDAQFFWNTDQKVPLVDRVNMLKAITFQKDLGSYHAKAARMDVLVTDISISLEKNGLKADRSGLQQAALLAKTDLTTELVKEFTELQGLVGGRYGEAQGLPKTVFDAIYDHYLPKSMEDSVPRTLEGAVLSIADKADTIAGMFALDHIPSGSKDPFGLRRQANGIIKTIAEHKLPISLGELFADALTAYGGSDPVKKFVHTGGFNDKSMRSFFHERLEFYLRDVLGLAYDVVNATLAADANDVVDAVARATAVAKVRPLADFESISTSCKRMKNILQQARESKKKIAEKVDASALVQPEEKQLAEAVPKIAQDINTLRVKGDYDAALLEISRLRPMIDAFFDKVMVMVDDESLRANRLGLLQTLVTEFSRIADFSEIVTGKEAISK